MMVEFVRWLPRGDGRRPQPCLSAKRIRICASSRWSQDFQASPGSSLRHQKHHRRHDRCRVALSEPWIRRHSPFQSLSPQVVGGDV